MHERRRLDDVSAEALGLEVPFEVRFSVLAGAPSGALLLLHCLLSYLLNNGAATRWRSVTLTLEEALAAAPGLALKYAGCGAAAGCGPPPPPADESERREPPRFDPLRRDALRRPTAIGWRAWRSQPQGDVRVTRADAGWAAADERRRCAMR